MPFYLYKCTKCDNIDEVSKPISKRDEPTICSTCGELSERMFCPNRQVVLMWKDQKGQLTLDGPTRKAKYTLGNVAEKNEWWKQWGIKK